MAESFEESSRVDGGPYNPDRVSVKRETVVKTDIVQPKERFTPVETRREVKEPSSVSLRFFRPDDARIRAVTLSAAAATVIGTVATNIENERKFGSGNEGMTDGKVIRNALETADMKTVVDETRKELCRVVDAELLHRFVIKDEAGSESINPGALIIPLSVGLKENCKVKIDVEVHIPYHFARTFSEVAAKSPDRRDEMIAKLAAFISQEAQNQLVIKGIAGVTETTYVYNREHNILAAGKPAIDLGKFDLSNLTLEGVASAEAEGTSMNVGAESLQGFNPENSRLAGKRLQDLRPMIMEALEKAGVDAVVLQNARNFRYEHNLTDAEIAKLAEISSQVLGCVIAGSASEQAYALVKAINDGNPKVLRAIESNPEYGSVIESTLAGNRGVNISFEAETEYGKTNVYNVAVPIALALLLLPRVRFERSEGKIRIESRTEYVRNPDIVREREVEIVTPVSRRLFSETTPESIEEGRSFHEVYAGIDLSERSRDTQALLQHMLIEEVLPSLDESTKEPLIDYEDIANVGRSYLSSDAKRDGVKKGSYPTIEDAQRKMTELLVEMWERHDSETYPMQGIDVKTVINYRHSEHVVYWAKTLAELLVKLAAETTTREEFRERLLDRIREAARSRSAQGNTARNAFVQSEFPQDHSRA